MLSQCRHQASAVLPGVISSSLFNSIILEPGYVSPAFEVNMQLLHCHIAWHVSEGLAMQFVERIDEIPGNVGVTQQWYDTCASWQRYQDIVNPPRDDSGV